MLFQISVFSSPFLHYRVNSRELGTYVAMKILETHLDPLLDSSASTSATNETNNIMPQSNTHSTPFTATSTNRLIDATKASLPKFSLPKTYTANLPGGLFYVRSSLPAYSMELNSMATGASASSRVCVVKVIYSCFKSFVVHNIRFQ